MKPAVLICTLMVLAASMTSAQLTLLPQFGFDRSKSNIQINNSSQFSPLDNSTFIKANLKLDYRFKGGHGPYVALGSSPGVVEYTFSDPLSAMNNFKAAAGSLQWRIEAGYQHSFQPITFKKRKKINAVAAEPVSTVRKKSCGSYSSRYRSHCGSQKKGPTKNNQLNMRIQPSIGFAYLPSVTDGLISKGSSYQYNAGNWNTAFVSGIGFEFGKGRERLMTLSISYTKGIGNLGSETITTMQNGKATTTSFESSTANWGLTVGVPFSLTKIKKAVKKSSYSKKSCAESKTIIRKCVKKI